MSKVVKHYKISNKLIISIILFSSLITLFITIAQLYFEYKEDINYLNKNISNIETGYREGITNALWLDDKQQLIAILNGINALPDIEYIEVQVNSELYAASGNHISDNIINDSFLLQHNYNEKLLTIGKVSIEANLSGIYQSLLTRTWTILISNAVKTFLVVLFMYYVFDRLVFRRLNKIFDFVKLHNVDDLGSRIHVDQKNTRSVDEISDLAHALNTMQEHLSLSLKELLRLKSTLDLSIDVVVMFHADSYKFFYVNTGATNLLGYSAEELMGMTPVNIISNFNEEKFYKTIKEATNNTMHVTQVETELLTKHGITIPVKLTLQYRNPENEQAWFIFIASDITKDKNNELILLRSLEDANTANDAKSKFLTSMSHELRTPLNAILGFSQLLQLDADVLTDNQNDAVNDIVYGGQHLFKLIEEILDLSSIESKINTLELEFIDPTDMTKECIKFVSSMATKKDIKLECNLSSGSLPEIKIDKTRFKQILINLLSNAIKYNDEGGSVILSNELLNNNTIRFKVTDTGYGIKASDHTHVFTPFNRLGHEGGSIEGTGIGLNITKKLVELMGGEINFKSNEGEGSEFWIDFIYKTAN